MIWLSFAAVLAALTLPPAVLLMQRKVRQARTAAELQILAPGGIAEQTFVSVGGIDQWISIRGEDRENPALLILHGGPGCSYSIFTPHLRGWEKHFTLIQWDQRGAGKTFARSGRRASAPMNFDRLALDAVEVAEYARRRLGKQRLFLMASSLGSVFGIQVAQRRPDLFDAYIGTDQNVGLIRARSENHQQLLARLRSLGLIKGARTVERIGANPAYWSPSDYEAIARWTMRSDTAGFKPTMKLLKDAVWNAPGWSFRDIRAFVAGMRFSLQQLLPDITRYDAWKQDLHFQIPFFILQGERDVLTTPNEARALFQDVTAPIRSFSLIPDAGHFAAFQQPNEFLKQLLIHVRPLAQVPVRTP